MDRKALAEKTRKIVEQGGYDRAGGRVDLAALVNAARSNTRLYRPDVLQALLDRPATGEVIRPRLEVTPESTAQAARRLVQTERVDHVVALNFASARNPGGGWLGGARAQEEDLAISSALVTCQVKAPAYYEENRKNPSLLYTDHIIYSPKIPFIRDDQGVLLKEPFLASVITAPAPNAGEYLRRPSDGLDGVRTTLRRRSGMVLSVARDQGHRTLILGAWGCGVFRNVPADVAEAFRAWIVEPRFLGAFDRVVFAILDRSSTGSTFAAFERVFSLRECPQDQ